MNCLYCVFEIIVILIFKKKNCTSAAAASDANTTAAFSPSATLIAAFLKKKTKMKNQGFNLPIDGVYVQQQLPIPLHLQHSHSEQFLEPIIVI